MTNKSIGNLNDLLGREVIFNYYDVDVDDNEIIKETKGIVSNAYIDDFSFYQRWNEPLYLKICFKPLEDRSIYKNIDKEDFTCIFTDEYSLDSIIEILN